MIKLKKAFTLIELMVVMLIIGIGLMSVTPKFAAQSVGQDRRLEFFNNLMKDELARAQELGEPVTFTGFKGSANISTYDKESKTIPDTKEVNSVKVNRYETFGNEYSIKVYPDGICDYFEISLNDGNIIESIPLLMITRYKNDNEM